MSACTLAGHLKSAILSKLPCPLFEVPFERIGMDLFVTLDHTIQGYQTVFLVIIVPLWKSWWIMQCDTWKPVLCATSPQAVMWSHSSTLSLRLGFQK